jgi:menaquinol-cytochrome c reductase iron-sulfur subunit
MGGVVAAAAGLPAALYLLVKPKSKNSGEWVEVAELDQLRAGQPEEIVYNRKRMDGWRRVDEKTSTWLVRTETDSVIAYNPACTHLGCAYHWDAVGNAGAGQFECPCHGSAFSMEGKVIAGPAPRPLDRYQARIDGGKVLINPETRSV